MREALSDKVGKSVTIRGTFYKYGTLPRRAKDGSRIVRFCLTNVYLIENELETYISDHIWLGRNTVVFNSGVLNKGDVLFVTGQVVEYTKGKEISDKFKSLDPKLWVSYTLSRVSKVERGRIVQDGI